MENSKLLPSKLHCQKQYWPLSLYHETSQLPQPSQLTSSQLLHPHFFSFTVPTPKKFKTISNNFNPWSFPPHFLQTANINTTSFQSLRYFPPLFWYRSHIPCWKPDSKLYIRRFYHHSSTSALSFASRDQCFLSIVSPMHCQHHKKAVILINILTAGCLS